MRLVVAILLTVVTSPVGTELVELAAHVVGHGDLPHHDDAAELACGEHTCTPLRHQCSCHSAMSAQLSPRHVTVTRFSGPATITTARAAIVDGRASDPPPLPPPIV